MAQVPEDIGCLNEKCIAKDGSAREIHEFSGSEVKKCGKFIQN
jgi:hypothetical protein